MGKLHKRDEREDGKSREGANGIEEAKKEEHKEEAKQTREARQGNSNKEAGTEEAGTKGTDKEQKEQKEQKELSGLVSIDEEQPEQLILEVKESKKRKKTKKTAKKTANKVKDEIKLALVSVYALAGATLDECFYLKPNESDLLAEAIYRYLEEHNLIHTISEKSALVNLIIALVSVNTPKFLEYYKKLKNKKEGTQNDEQEREAKLDSGQGANGMPGGQPNNNNAKTYLTEFYNPDEGR